MKYIGTKIVEAHQMTDQEFNYKFKGKKIPVGDIARDGYHVVYPNQGGGTYDSWSPKLPFESSYRVISKDEIDLISDVDK